MWVVRSDDIMVGAMDSEGVAACRLNGDCFMIESRYGWDVEYGAALDFIVYRRTAVIVVLVGLRCVVCGSVAIVENVSKR